MKKILFSVVLLCCSYGVNAARGDLIDKVNMIRTVFSSPALGYDGKSYILDGGGQLFSFETDNSGIINDGEFIFGFREIGLGTRSPVIGEDNLVYVWGSRDKFGSNGKNIYFYAIDLITKDEKWRELKQYFGSEPAIDMHGNVYFTVDDTLFAHDHLGEKLWSVVLDDYELSDIAIDTEVIYVRSKNTSTNTSGIIAFRNDGQIKWETTISNSVVASYGIAVASNGDVVFAFSNEVSSLNPVDGQINWQYQVDGDIIGSPVIDENDNVIVAAKTKVYSINNQGISNWLSPFVLPDDETTDSTPSLSATGNIYVTSYEYYGNIYSIDSQSGQEQWRTSDMGMYTSFSPLVLNHGAIIVGDTYGTGHFNGGTSGGRPGDIGYLRLFESDPGGLLSPSISWPMYRGNQQHTAMRNTGIYEKEVYMDNGDENTSAQGGWLIIHGDITVIVPLPGGQWEETTDGSNYEGDSFHIASSESESLIFSWSFTATSTGNHSIEANIPVRADNTIAAVYSVLDSSGSEVCGPATVDQEINAGTWVEVTECMLEIDQEYTLKLENADGIVGRKLIADAIRVNRK